MTDLTREQWIEKLDGLTRRRPDEAVQEWQWLMRELGLGPSYFLAVHEALKQGRWREAREPGAYLKVVARRKASSAMNEEATAKNAKIAKNRREEAEEEIADIARHRSSSPSSESPSKPAVTDGLQLSKKSRNPRTDGAPERNVMPKARRKVPARESRARRELLGRGLRGKGKLKGVGDVVPDVDMEREPSSEGEKLETMQYRHDTETAVKGNDGVWRAGASWNAGGGSYDDEEGGEYDSYRDFLMSDLPAELTIEEAAPAELQARAERMNNSAADVWVHVGTWKRPDWEKWAQAAGFNQWELKALKCKLFGISRERSIAEQPDEESRKAMQAAWRRFERSGMQRLKEAAQRMKKSFPQDVAE